MAKRVVPDGVMRRIQVNDVTSQAQDSVTELSARHDGSQVGHGFAVFFGIGDCGQGVGAAVVLREGFDVGPCWVVSVTDLLG